MVEVGGSNAASSRERALHVAQDDVTMVQQMMNGGSVGDGGSGGRQDTDRPTDRLPTAARPAATCRMTWVVDWWNGLVGGAAPTG